MGKPKRKGKPLPYTLPSAIEAFLDLPLGPGFAAVPALFDAESVEKSTLQLRQTFYFDALNVMTKADWNLYIQFGFQQFANPLDYLKCVNLETEEEAEIRVYRYFRLHQEADEVVNIYLNALANEIRGSFLKSRSPFLKMSVKQIDEHVSSSLLNAKVARVQYIVDSEADTADDDNNVDMLENDEVKDTRATETDDKMAMIEPVTEKPSRSPSVIRLVVRWSPKDFDNLSKNRDEFNRRLAPILSAIHTPDHPLVEWQTSQASSEAEILPADVSRLLSIKIAPSHKTKTFTFGFRICTSGAKLKNILQSKALASVKKGEALHFEPSTVPVTQGDIVHVGDILLKDATVTHRAHYKSFLSKCKLPDDMPEFDIKLRHKDPLGVKAPILIIRCGATVATKVAEILCTTLNGQGDSKEIFISKLGLGASKMSRATLTSLYEHHHSYVRESVHLPFKTSRNIDSIRTEYFDDGKTCERSPRNWARSLQVDEKCQGIDLANGTANGLAVLIAPAEVVDFAKEQLRLYELRQYPVLGGATHFYETTKLDPSIPDTVFTSNITFLLSQEKKALRKKPQQKIQTANAWKTPLTDKKKKPVPVAATSPDDTVTGLKHKNEMLQARINALEEEKTSNGSQSMKSASTESTPAEDTTLTLESVHTICERMFSTRMLQLERMQEKSDRKVELMFEKLLNRQANTADGPKPSTEAPSELATVDNGLVLLQDTTRRKKQKRNQQQQTQTQTNIDSQPPQYNSMETDEEEKC